MKSACDLRSEVDSYHDSDGNDLTDYPIHEILNVRLMDFSLNRTTEIIGKNCAFSWEEVL